MDEIKTATGAVQEPATTRPELTFEWILGVIQNPSTPSEAVASLLHCLPHLELEPRDDGGLWQRVHLLTILGDVRNERATDELRKTAQTILVRHFLPNPLVLLPTKELRELITARPYLWETLKYMTSFWGRTPAHCEGLQRERENLHAFLRGSWRELGSIRVLADNPRADDFRRVVSEIEICLMNSGDWGFFNDKRFIRRVSDIFVRLGGRRDALTFSWRLFPGHGVNNDDYVSRCRRLRSEEGAALQHDLLVLSRFVGLDLIVNGSRSLAPGMQTIAQLAAMASYIIHAAELLPVCCTPR